jgi:hypothetical protein
VTSPSRTQRCCLGMWGGRGIRSGSGLPDVFSGIVGIVALALDVVVVSAAAVVVATAETVALS